MFIIAKALKGKEFMYKKSSMILCKNKKQANELAKFMNEHNDTTKEGWKLQDNETWYTYEIDEYDSVPPYKIKSTKGKIAVVRNENI